jgi:hypothetical protein
MSAKKATTEQRAIQKFDEIYLPADPNEENGYPSFEPSKLKMSRESQGTFLIANSVDGDEPVKGRLNVIFLFASAYSQCNCSERNSENLTNLCFTYDYNNGYSTKGYHCKDKCPYKNKDLYKRSFKLRLYFAVQHPKDGKFVVCTYNSTIDAIKDVKAMFKQIRSSLYREHRVQSASHAVISIKNHQVKADWNPAIKFPRYFI